MTITLYPKESLAATGETFDTSILAGTKSPNTIEQYEMHFRAYCDFAGRFPVAMQPATLARWRQHLYEGGYTFKDGLLRKYSVNAINQRLAAVRALLSEAAQQGYITHELAEQFKQVKGLKQVANKERRREHVRTPITAAQMRAICDQPNTLTLAGLMHRALLLTLAGCGMRISEAVTLKGAQLRWAVNDETGRAGWVADIAGKNKVEAEARALSTEAYAAIQAWLNARPVESEYIFTSFAGRGDRAPSAKPLSRVSGWQMVKRYAAQAGCPNVKPHDLRRFVGTQVNRQHGLVAAQKQLGHARLETTAKHYVLDGEPVGVTDGLF